MVKCPNSSIETPKHYDFTIMLNIQKIKINKNKKSTRLTRKMFLEKPIIAFTNSTVLFSCFGLE